LALAQRAPSPFDSARALELGQLAFNWHQRGLALVDRKSLVGSDLEARSSDHRTADEIGVLYTTSVVYGIATGLWLDVQTEPKSVSTGVLPPLLLAGAAVGGVALLDSGRGLRYGVAQSMASGLYIGLWQGIAWTTYLQATTSHQNQLSTKQYATALWSSATLGAVVGGVVGTASSTTPGRASFVSSATLWPALVLGLGVAGMSADNQYRDDHAFLAASLGATGGVVAGILTAGTVSPTTARVRFLDLGGLGGTLVGGGLYLAAANNHSKFEPAAIMTALGASAGLAVAWVATSNMPRDEGAVPRTASFDVHPQLSPQHGGASLGFAGSF
jgi:energy-converting hydrogenase Eha subunit A